MLRGRDHLSIAIAYEGAFQLCLGANLRPGWKDDEASRVECCAMLLHIGAEVEAREHEAAMQAKLSAAVKRQRRGERRRRTREPSAAEQATNFLLRRPR